MGSSAFGGMPNKLSRNIDGVAGFGPISASSSFFSLFFWGEVQGSTEIGTCCSAKHQALSQGAGGSKSGPLVGSPDLPQETQPTSVPVLKTLEREDDRALALKCVVCCQSPTETTERLPSKIPERTPITVVVFFPFFFLARSAFSSQFRVSSPFGIRGSDFWKRTMAAGNGKGNTHDDTCMSYTSTVETSPQVEHTLNWQAKGV